MSRALIGAGLLAGGRFHEAAAFYAQALRRQPTSLAARLGLARAHAGRGEFREAIGCLLMGGMSHAERAAGWRHRRGQLRTGPG